MFMDGAIPKGRQQPMMELTSANLDFVTSVVAAQVADGIVRLKSRKAGGAIDDDEEVESDEPEQEEESGEEGKDVEDTGKEETTDEDR